MLILATCQKGPKTKCSSNKLRGLNRSTLSCMLKCPTASSRFWASCYFCSLRCSYPPPSPLRSQRFSMSSSMTYSQIRMKIQFSWNTSEEEEPTINITNSAKYINVNWTSESRATASQVCFGEVIVDGNASSAWFGVLCQEG
jgi:hypothetical protein